jgi:hypothetical protein
MSPVPVIILNSSPAASAESNAILACRFKTSPRGSTMWYGLNFGAVLTFEKLHEAAGYAQQRMQRVGWRTTNAKYDSACEIP